MQKALLGIDAHSDRPIQMSGTSILDAEGCMGAGGREHNCCMLCKAGINESVTSGSEDNPFADLLEKMPELQCIQPELAPAKVTPEE